jgi:hypothetical protein
VFTVKNGFIRVNWVLTEAHWEPQLGIVTFSRRMPPFETGSPDLPKESCRSAAAAATRPVGTFLHILCGAPKREGLASLTKQRIPHKKNGPGKRRDRSPNAVIRDAQTVFRCSADISQSLIYFWTAFPEIKYSITVTNVEDGCLLVCCAV